MMSISSYQDHGTVSGNPIIENIQQTLKDIDTTDYLTFSNVEELKLNEVSQIMKKKTRAIIESSQKLLELIKKTEDLKGQTLTDETISNGAASTSGVAEAIALRKY